ncbi:PQQ-binding-like beta-propeller repeat protein [Spirillospora sp. NPDC127200]
MQPLQADDPEHLGPYLLLARLGAGGMGRVHLARSPAGRPVAVKVVHAELAAEPDFRARFRREITAAGRVSGAFTAAVIDADPDAPAPWLATAFLPGLSLDAAVAAHGPFPLPAVTALGAALAEGLAAVHRAGVVHRDLKPGNVQLTPDGPRVLDFGIARPADSGAITRSGMMVGSPGYMSPEQAAGEDTGPAGDVFALGAVLVFTATGQGPFGTGPMHAMLYRIRHEPPQIGGVADPALRALIAACLEKDPARRPAVEQIARTLLAGIPDHTPAQGTGWLPPPVAASIARNGANLPQVPLRAAPGQATLPSTPPVQKSRRRVLLLGAGGTVAGLGVLTGLGFASAEMAKKTDDTEYVWKHKPSDGARIKYGPVLSGGLVFAHTDRHRLLALDARTGALRWSRDIGSGIRLSAQVAGDVVVVHESYSMRGLEARTGAQRWSVPVKGGTVSGFFTAANGLVYLAGEQDHVPGLLVLDAATGRVRRHHRTIASVEGAPVLANGVLYYGGGLEVFAVDPATGRRLWRRDVGEEATGTPEVADGLLHITRIDSAVVTLDARTGRPRWRAATSASPADKDAGGGRLTVHERTVYAADPGDRLHAFDAATGKKRWDHWMGGGKGGDIGTVDAFHLMPAVIGRTACVVGGDLVVGLDTATGRPLWRHRPSVFRSERPVAAAGRFHVATYDGLLSIDAASGEVAWKGPDFTAQRAAAQNGIVYYTGGDFDTGFSSDTTLYALRPS